MSPFGPIGGARRLVGRIGRAAMVQAYEAGLMASIAARTPLHLVGGGGMLAGFAERIAHETEIPVHLVDAPLECVVLGAGRCIEAATRQEEP